MAKKVSLAASCQYDDRDIERNIEELQTAPAGHAHLAADGTLSKDVMPDLLHPNAEDYRRWAEEMQPELARLMR